MAPKPTITYFDLIQVAKWLIFDHGLILMVLVDPKLLLFGPVIARMVLVDRELPMIRNCKLLILLYLQLFYLTLSKQNIHTYLSLENELILSCKVYKKANCLDKSSYLKIFIKIGGTVAHGFLG